MECRVLKLGEAELAKAHKLFNEGRVDQAERAYRRLSRQLPRFADAHFFLGTLLASTGRFEAAIESLGLAASLAPNTPGMAVNLAVALRLAGRRAESADLLAKTVAAHPTFFEAWANLGIAQREAGQLDAAIASYEKAIALRRTSAEVLWNLASTLQEAGLWQESARRCRDALAFAPDLAHAKLGLGLFHLATGNWLEGWPLYEFRWLTVPEPPSALPRWRGESVEPGDGLLVFDEQGIGDAIQFSRYLELAAERFASVAYVCPEALRPLFARNLPRSIELLAAPPADESNWHWHCPLLSLPLAFGTVPGTVPPPCRWITPDENQRDRWRRVFAADRGELPRVGIVRAGNPAMKYARWRDVAAEEIAALWSVSGIAWVNLQKDRGLCAPEGLVPPVLNDPTAELSNFDDTAALISALDLVIAVDTAVAHLAAQLGKPTWLLSWGEWRWLPNRVDTPWYPTMRIYARDAGAGWAPCLAQVRRDLETWRDQHADNRLKVKKHEGNQQINLAPTA